jgi:hypothetical membrane protein
VDTATSDGTTRDFATVAARVALAAATAELLLLASLHVLSPEFDPAWRVISEYALGQYGWVLTLMFLAAAFNVWALAAAVWPHVATTAGKIGVGLLIVAGVGPAMASVFAIDHPLHDLAGLIGVLGLPVAAMVTSVSLSRTPAWAGAKKTLLWTANLTWVSVVVFVATMIILFVTFTQAGGDPAGGQVTRLPPGVIAVNGWANRLVLVASAAWVIAVGWQANKRRTRAALRRSSDRQVTHHSSARTPA